MPTGSAKLLTSPAELKAVADALRGGVPLRGSVVIELADLVEDLAAGQVAITDAPGPADQLESVVPEVDQAPRPTGNTSLVGTHIEDVVTDEELELAASHGDPSEVPG